MLIIINCDDLGASTQVNRSIFGLMEQGRVTSATLMMNAPAVLEAVEQLHKYPGSSFGVHLNVTEFRPLSPHVGLKPLLNENGDFDKDIGGALRIPLTSAIRNGIFAEWCAQIERARELGVPISHLDSHHHVHTRPGFFAVLKRVQRKFGIRKVRIRRNVGSVSTSIRAPLHLARQSAWNFALRYYFRTRTTAEFMGFSGFHERLLAEGGWPATIEVMCHPGHEKYTAESELLCGAWRERLRQDAQLISYNEL
jgi:predicted glycoside hydrolase/deacetylase ChbG (UPF0249 family)